MVKRKEVKKPFEKLLDIGKRKEVKDMMKKQKKLKKLFDDLINAESHPFPREGESLKAPKKPGIYIILDEEDNVLYAGSTRADKSGIDKKLQAHIDGESPWISYDFDPESEQEGKACRFKYIEKPGNEIPYYLEFLCCISPIPPQTY